MFSPRERCASFVCDGCYRPGHMLGGSCSVVPGSGLDACHWLTTELVVCVVYVQRCVLNELDRVWHWASAALLVDQLSLTAWQAVLSPCKPCACLGNLPKSALSVINLLVIGEIREHPWSPLSWAPFKGGGGRPTSQPGGPSLTVRCLSSNKSA